MSTTLIPFGLTMPLIAGCCFMLVVLVSVRCDFISASTTVKTNENDTVLLPCYIERIDTDYEYLYRIRWYKDNGVLADSGPPVLLPPDRYKLWGNGSLQVFRVQASDTAEYTCEVMRPDPWRPVKQTHAIEVLHPPFIESEPEEGYLQVKEGEEVRFTCHGKGVPAPIMTWKRNGKDLKLITNRNVLTFIATDRHLAGIYACVATNGVGESAVKEFQLKITYPPELTTMKSWIHSAPGFRAQLDCRVTSDPISHIMWYKDDDSIKYNNRVLFLKDDEKYSLIIKDVQKSDFGVYICKAVNNVGEETLEFQLSGAPNPAEFKATDSENAGTQHSYTLIWEVDSLTDVIEYSLWFRPYKYNISSHIPEWTMLTIPSDHKNSGYTYSKMYAIKGLKENTMYEALLLSRNRYGWSKASPIYKFTTKGTGSVEHVSQESEATTEDVFENIISAEISSKGFTVWVNSYILFVVCTGTISLT